MSKKTTKQEVVVVKQEPECWDSGLVFIEPKLIINRAILYLCEAYQDELKDNEFSILVKAEETDEGWKLDSTEHYVPKQEVTGISVDYKESLTKYKKEGFNVVIHSHPFESDSFSSADEEFINSNFQISVLFSEGKFTAAIMNLKIGENKFLRLKPEIEMFHYIPDKVDVSNIKANQTQNYSYYDYYGSWGKKKDKEEEEGWSSYY